VQSLKTNDCNLLLFSLFKPNPSIVKKYIQLDIPVASPDLSSKIKNLRKPNLSKVRYITSIFYLNRVIKKFKPDIVHAHYASSYGVLGLLSGFKPLIVSIWGSDIYDFPNKFFLNRWILKLVIKSADQICSTSNAMKKIIEVDYNRIDTKVVPFGIDTNLFMPNKIPRKSFKVGIIKSIEEYNGIDCFLDAIDIIVNKYCETRIKFIIVGKGSLQKHMKEKTAKMKLQKYVIFKGFVSHDKILKYHQQLSVFIAVSTRESFGVSILEAAACEVPAITSNIGGLTEVNINQKTGIVIEPNKPKKLADSILKLYKNKDYRIKLGKNARKRVVQNFDWNQNIREMINIYKKVVSKL